MNSSQTPDHWPNDDSRTPEPQLSELEWLAFCYLADELSPAQQAEFERRLETDASAQQALVVQMELTAQIAASQVASVERHINQPHVAQSAGLPRTTGRQFARRSKFWIAIAATLFVLGGSWIGGQFYNSKATAQLAEIQLADEWAYQISELPELTEDPNLKLSANDPWDHPELAGEFPTSGSLRGEYWSDLHNDEESLENSWIYAAAMALDDDDFDWLQGLFP